MSDALQLNLTGRVMLSACRHGVTERDRIALYVRAISDALAHYFPDPRPSLKEMEPVINQQLELLEAALCDAQARAQEAAAEQSCPLPLSQDMIAPEEAEAEEPVAKKARRRRKPLQQSNPGAAQAKSMEEKLRDGRKPVQALLTQDCVAMGLVDQKQAARLVKSMFGKQPEEAELAIVEHLRQSLQDQVRKMVRRQKGNGPWASPRAQEDLRQDIHAARSVKSVLMLTRQVVKEQQAWEEKHGKGGMLGLFASRRKLVG